MGATDLWMALAFDGPSADIVTPGLGILFVEVPCFYKDLTVGMDRPNIGPSPTALPILAATASAAARTCVDRASASATDLVSYIATSNIIQLV